jgi:hypothetical protein
MDPATASGQVTLSAGTVTSTTWQDSRNLVIDHTAWDEGVQVTVTVGTGLADEAGNTLAAPHSFSFYVFSSTLTVLETNPADGAVDVNRDSNVQILFSREVDETSLANHTTITDNLGRASYDFDIDSQDEAVTLIIAGRLAANAEITVTLGADVQAWGGGTLGSEYAFSFTTGVDVDETPPTVVSSFPVVGATVDPDVGYFQVTFSEPMNPMSFEPAAWNAELALILMNSDVEPTWNADHTVVTVPLPSPLPDGLPMEIVFAELTDANGVTNPEEWIWHAAVSGSPDYYPVSDGLEIVFVGYWEEGELGNSDPTWSGDDHRCLKVEMQADDSFHLVSYEEGGFSEPTGEYEVYKKTSSQLQWLGFTEEVEPDVYEEMAFDSPLNILPLPLSAGTWTDDTTVTIPGEGTFAATITGTVTSIGDYHPDGGSREDIYFKDVFRVISVLDVEFDGQPAMVDTDTTWYSPTIGPIHMSEHEVSTMDDMWWYSDYWRVFDVVR